MLASKLTRRMFATDLGTRVSPSSWYYLLNYGIKASQVSGSGPRGLVTKSDLILFIEKNNLKRVEHPKEQAPAAVVAPANKKPAPKKQASTQSPAVDPKNPFQQTWVDQPVADATHAQSLYDAKRYLAHTYLSAKFDAAGIYSVFG